MRGTVSRCHRPRGRPGKSRRGGQSGPSQPAAGVCQSRGTLAARQEPDHRQSAPRNCSDSIRTCMACRQCAHAAPACPVARPPAPHGLAPAGRRHELQRVFACRAARRVAAVRPCRRCPAGARDRARSAGAPHLALLACLRAAASAPGRSTPSAPTARSTRRAGLRFDADKVLLDPYGRAVAMPAGLPARRRRMRRAATTPRPARAWSPTTDAYDWEGDAPLRRPFAQTVIYEMHVRGFTRHPSSGVRRAAARHLRRAGREDPLPASTWASPPSS